ncbi:MAG TPA: redoxin domain-containing protein [Saprospiraceae bacterium]|nr:redoxin domain-containing protein [Saprospiraceae bacterium]
MRILILFIGILLSVLTTSAQPAPDFTVTDSKGHVRHLYADYLNQGKTVVLEIFFTTCPPCNSIAPLMQPLYEEWGEGQNDVEFIELSNKNFDTDALVNAYQVTYNETFIGVGKDGGSLSAVVPYQNGTYGQFFGTPTFIVISPNGTVNYGVSGSGNQATINAIDAAITATGALKPGQIPIASDFTVTDVDGVTHHFYSDFLNQGKTVLLEIFNSTCSACSTISPLLQTLYQDWGVGNHDVEIIALTDKNTDTDAILQAYQESHGETFVAVSKDGGSLPAIVIYQDGTFGPPSSDPVFVVIAPNGTVQYNVHGSGNIATIDAINAALIATGAENPPPVTQAPDFTITDSHGQIHHLYADYLDQGKSVMIEVFYTTCPPCNSIAPLMEPFYQEWGAGDHDVAFFELSDKNFDSDALVNAYQSTYGETFVAAGKDGGSLTAVAPYKSGQFGPWYGTPTYIVIAPDRTIQYDVSGANNQATIDALDAALLATGAVKPTPVENPVSVTGLVQFLQGSAGAGNAYVQMLDGAGNVIVQDTTDINGSFDLQYLLSQSQPDWKIGVVKNGLPLNGVSAIDVVRMQKHVLHNDTLDTPLLKIAADVNKSGTISSLDIVMMLKLLLGKIQNFPDSQTWIVIPADTDFAPIGDPQPVISNTTIPLADIISGARQPNFVAVKKGDVDGTASPGQ